MAVQNEGQMDDMHHEMRFDKLSSVNQNAEQSSL